MCAIGEGKKNLAFVADTWTPDSQHSSRHTENKTYIAEGQVNKRQKQVFCTVYSKAECVLHRAVYLGIPGKTSTLGLTVWCFLVDLTCTLLSLHFNISVYF